MSAICQTASTPAPVAGNRLAPLLRMVAGWWRGYTTWRNRQLAIAALQRLDDRLLKDIGISRSEVNSVIYTGGSGRIGRFRAPRS